MKNEARPPRRLAYTWHCVVRNAKSYNLSALLSSWRLLLYYACADGPQFSVISPAEKCRKCLPRGPARSISKRGALCFSSHVTRGFRNIQKQETIRLKAVQLLADKNTRSQTLKCSWRKLTKIIWRLNGVVLRGHEDPSYLHLVSLFRWGKRFWDAFVRNKGGGTRKNTRMVALRDVVETFR